MTNLDNGVAVITGAAGGIGLGMAKACAGRAMKLVVADLDGARAAEAAASLRADGAEAVPHACDVRELSNVEELRDLALDEFGRIDLVCNNAGIGLAKPIGECTPADWALLFAVNVTGVTNGIQAFLPHLVARGSGHISATASLSGLVADPDLVIYNGTKFAVAGMMEGLALEMERDGSGVSASVLCPGPVATDLIATSAKALVDEGSAAPDDHAVAEYLARGASPDDVGRLAIDGIANGDFWLLPHADLTFELMEPRFEAMKQRRLFIPPEWTEQ